MSESINEAMSRRLSGGEEAFPHDAADVKAMRTKMVTLSDRFYSLLNTFVRKGPTGLATAADSLLDEVSAFEASTRLSLGW